MKLGFIGLGKMGTRMVEKLLREDHEIVAWNRTPQIAEEFRQIMADKKLDQNLTIAKSIEELSQNLPSPKIIWSMLPAGDATEYVMQELLQLVKSNDIVIDGGNSYFKDTQKHYQKFSQKGIQFLGIGVSGGIHGPVDGYPLMVGGDESAYQHIAPILESLAKPHGGFEYFGTGGAGHFVKMVHNAIEYSYMQGIGEGFGVMEKAPYKLDLAKVAKLYTKNTLISGYMMDRTIEALEVDPDLSHIAGVIGSASKETVWTVEQAKEEGVVIENISQALDFRNRSKDDEKVQNSFAAKIVTALREQFGGHKIKEKE